MSSTNPHSSPPSLTLPSMPTLQACSTRFNKGTNYLANNAFSMATKLDLAMYYHRAAFSPVLTTFITAIKNGDFSTWTGLTAELISKHLPKSLATSKCHDKLAIKNIRSNRPQDPTPDLPVTRTKTIHITVLEPSDLLATDITGHFPTISSGGYNHIIVCYIYDTNGIIVRLMKKRSVTEHIRVYQEIFDYLEKLGTHPDVHKMDNECPQELKDIIVDQHKNKMELVTPHDHRNNPAEKCIDTFKCHLIYGLSAMEPNFPLHLWCHILP